MCCIRVERKIKMAIDLYTYMVLQSGERLSETDKNKSAGNNGQL